MRDWKAFFEEISVPDRNYKINEPMSRHSTYGIGGPADVFVTPVSIDELQTILRKADEEKIPVTVVGGGSNLLVSDLGIRGITICTTRLKPEITCEETWITAMGGAGTGTVSRTALKNNLKGFEWAVGIPGTVCGAVFMNANGYGYQMKNVVEEVYTLTRDGKERKTYGWDDLRYGESDSVFMHNGDVIIGVKIHLSPGNADEINRNMQEHQISRRTKQPLEKRSAGTMYLRPPGYHVGPMIKACGLIGYSVGDAQVSTKHPDFVVNNGHATCEEVLAVLHEVQRRIQAKYNIHVPLDVRILGEGVMQER
jgi:UDP-N-acetylmuramate dehydrogenase